MKKALSPLNIDKKLYTRMTHLLTVNPDLGYKSKTQVVEKTIEEKLDKMENDMVLRAIKEEGITGFKEKTRDIIDKFMQLKKEMGETKKSVELATQTMVEIKKKIHTPRVYKSKKK